LLQKVKTATITAANGCGFFASIVALSRQKKRGLLRYAQMLSLRSSYFQRNLLTAFA
jgi:hypothetical protein